MKRTDDYYARQARKAGYAARSVYKLEEMQRRFQLIRRGDRVLDIGAAPGSWSQYCLQILAGRGLLVAVDLKPAALPAGEGYRYLEGDIFSPDLRQELLRLGRFDLVLSDAAPATTGNRTVDTQASLALGRRVRALAAELLRPGGRLALKLFQGQEAAAFVRELGADFARVRTFKPQASRKESMELYVIAVGYGSTPGAGNHKVTGK
jgi:23S rRNA (uridine2552-2'-O)-methyltransferase